MARIELAPEVLDDFNRFIDHLARFEVSGGAARIREIVQALDILTHSPFIGRPVRGGKRELVIGRGSRGYVALYRYMIKTDTIFVLAVRHRSEAGYKCRRD